MTFMDSRARDLQRKIDDGEYLGIREFKGATLRQLTNKASKHLERYLFDVTYVAGCVCNITSKAEATDRISFEWDPPEGVVEHLKWTLKKADEFMKEHHPAARVVFCPLVGVELQRVVNGHAVSEDQQRAVDEEIFEFNTNVFEVNKKRDTFSPSLHRSVHRSARGVRKSYYHYLADGLHLPEELKDKWAAEIVKATKNN